ncbi:hypothetical protein DPMN_126078 [Dreissena polymorpha]|uniref:Uncharacterized protein n=1 Tax=Dreissena polymorpha TaxID=45954 RepID=A0A9D4GWC7_DREPO|nr:hypothetical protein DPMN_126078 [Dreissena polymorpha]
MNCTLVPRANPRCDQEQELMPPFQPNSFNAIWPFVPSTVPDRLPPASPSLFQSLFRFGLPHSSSQAKTSTQHCRFQFYGCVNTNFSIKAISQKDEIRETRPYEPYYRRQTVTTESLDITHGLLSSACIV